MAWTHAYPEELMARVKYQMLGLAKGLEAK